MRGATRTESEQATERPGTNSQPDRANRCDQGRREEIKIKNRLPSSDGLGE